MPLFREEETDRAFSEVASGVAIGAMTEVTGGRTGETGTGGDRKDRSARPASRTRTVAAVAPDRHAESLLQIVEMNENAQLDRMGAGGQMIGRRLWAAAALLLALVAIGLAVAVAVAHFPKGLSVLVCLVLAACAAWYGARRRGTARTIGIGAAALLLCGAIVLVIVEGRVLEDLLVIAGVVGALAAARLAFRGHVHWPQASRPAHPVLFYNPKSRGRRRRSVFTWPTRRGGAGSRPSS